VLAVHGERKVTKIIERAKEFFFGYCLKMIVAGSILVSLSQLLTVSKIGMSRAITVSVSFFVIITSAALFLSLYVGFIHYIEEKKSKK